MARLDEIAKSLADSIDGSLGVGIVNLNTGRLLGSSYRSSYMTEDLLGALATAAVDMFRGRTITQVESLFADLRGVPRKRLWQEMHVSSENTYHFMLVLPNKPDALLVLVTDKQASLGMSWASLRRVAPDVEAQLL